MKFAEMERLFDHMANSEREPRQMRWDFAWQTAELSRHARHRGDHLTRRTTFAIAASTDAATFVTRREG